MNKIIVSIAFVSLFLMNCKQQKEEKYAAVSSQHALAVNSPKSTTNDEGYELLKSKCYACHSVSTKSHDDIIAPPMIAVKRHYINNYDNKKDFVNAIVNWALDPKEENAVMFGAVRRFKVMPKMGFKKEELTKIASYIYDNEIETPAWFGGHMKEMKQGKGCKTDKGSKKGCKDKSCKGKGCKEKGCKS